MMEEAGGRSSLERQLEEFWTQDQMKLAARIASPKPNDPKWEAADRLAMELLREM